MSLTSTYARQMAVIRRLRDRHLADVDDQQSLWRPRQDIPPIAWHAAHASLFTAITLIGMGEGDWAFAKPEEMQTFNVSAPTPGWLPALSALRPRIAAWDAASDAAAARAGSRLEGILPHRHSEWLPDDCRTWADGLSYMVTHEPFHHGEIALLRRLAGHRRVE
jgi:uncharacterized damage-inducible protein DinB